MFLYQIVWVNLKSYKDLILFFENLVIEELIVEVFEYVVVGAERLYLWVSSGVQINLNDINY